MSVSRKDLYSYVASMFVGVVKGIYKHMPTALCPDDIANGYYRDWETLIINS